MLTSSGSWRAMRLRVCCLLAQALLCASWGTANAAATGPNVRYTSVAERDCWKPSASAAAVFDKRGVTAQECAGLEGWRVFVVSSDERSWLELAHDRSLWSAEKQVVYDEPFGNFPNVGAGRIEWHVGSTRIPTAVVFRVSAQSRDAARPRALSRLFVVSLADGSPRSCGTSDTNEHARRLAAQPAACKSALQAYRLD